MGCICECVSLAALVYFPISLLSSVLSVLPYLMIHIFGDGPHCHSFHFRSSTTAVPILRKAAWVVQQSTG